MASEKLKRTMADQGEELPTDMSSMIDLVFLLLIFFMVSSHLITVQIDERVKPPVAANAQVARNTEGRVVVNILDDGTIWGVGKKELSSVGMITDYIRNVKDNNPSQTIRLHLRADKQVETKDIKKVIKASGEAGVSNVIFSSFVVDN